MSLITSSNFLGNDFLCNDNVSYSATSCRFFSSLLERLSIKFPVMITEL